MPLFSIITAVYNNERYIRSAAESILSQSCKDLEYIIVDDGSTDNTSQIVDEIAKEDSRVKVIHQKNQWIYASFNNGIKQASGDYVYIVNSDDRLRVNALNLMKEKICRYDPDIIWTKVLVHRCDRYQNIMKYDRNHEMQRGIKEAFFQNEETVRKNWIMFYKTGLAQNQANLYRRSIMQRHFFRNDVYAADTLFNIDIASDIKSALILEEPVYDFLEYDDIRMNASVRKYYGYEHRMFNELYLGYKKLFESWNCYGMEERCYLSGRRLKNITMEIRILQAINCELTLENKLRKIFEEYLDDTIYECAVAIDAQEELESRIVSGLRELFLEESPARDSEMYFAYDLVNSLLKYEKSEDDFNRIERAVNHPVNRYHIGLGLYNKIKGDERFV